MAIMLIDNQGQEEDLADYACALAAQLAALLDKPTVGLRMNKFDWVVAEFMKRGSQHWTEADITKVLRYVVVTSASDRGFANQIHHHFVNLPPL